MISQVWTDIYGGGYTGNIWFRSTLSIGSTPFPFGPWKRITPEVGQDYAGRNAMLLQDFTRRRGPVHTNGKAAVAYRFDHGLGNYRDFIKPMFDARGWKHSQALNSGQWSASEMGGVTPAIVDGWVQEGLLEIWHHGLDHTDTGSEGGFMSRIVNSLDTLKSQIPSATIDGYCPPGVGGDSYLGFNGGNSAEAFFNTEAGRLVLSHHAVSSGYISGTAYHRKLDGVIRHGLGHITADTLSAATLNNRLDTAIANGEGMQVMLHPSQLNLTDKITAAEFEAHLDYVQQKVDEGLVVVLSPYELVLADKTPVAPIELGDRDLNTLLTSGTYIQPSSVNAGGANNYPEGRAGSVTVIGNSGGTLVNQIYHSYGATNRVWHRTYYSGTWYPWQADDTLDTGWRDLSGLLTNGWVAETQFRVRRVGDKVTLRIHRLNGSAASTSSVIALPSGFRPTNTTELFIRSDEAGTVMKLLTLRWDGAMFLSTGTVTTNNGGSEWTFSTNANWPTTLPGTAV
ncbi:hypothetical protein [Zhihengliuella halotolerans]|uniref:Polysaccharide deacetylase n=1 Tax=Zhihengliuella halotolerans TaxID=370736 RepID=A0A4Q8ACW3_9MICC|nr:hypothetical protein [Zhihengliuella halotolerans]RZU61453.1 hypothetical protein EV380_1023 [Zhihengliuella halotolerans]